MTTLARQRLEDLLGGPIGREGLDKITDAIFESYASVDLAHNLIRDMTARLQEEDETDDRSQVEKVGILLYALGEYEQAFDRLHEVRHRKNAAHFLGRVCLKLRREEEALEYLEKGSNGDDDHVTHVLMVQAHAALRQHKEAEQLARKVPAETPDGLYARGLAAEAIGQYHEAMEHYEGALESDPEHAGALFRLGLNCDLNGEDKRAIELYQRCGSLKSAFVGALINLGILYEDYGDYYQAVDCYRRVLAIAPRDQTARMYLKDAESSLSMYMDTRQVRRMRRVEEVMQLPVSGFELSPRSRACLDRMGVKTLGGLTRLSRDQLLSEKNFGDTSLTEIEALLTRYELNLSASQEEALAEPDQDEQEPQGSVVSIEELNLSTRCRKCMDRLGVKSAGELAQHTEKELLAVPNFGGTSLNEIRTKLAALGLSLKSE